MFYVADATDYFLQSNINIFVLRNHQFIRRRRRISGICVALIRDSRD